MEEENITVDEVIINIVRDNKFLYDKTDVNYKNNNKRKDAWRIISLQLKDVYNVDMSDKYILSKINQLIYQIYMSFCIS